jgi:ATP synthase I chain
MNDYGDRSGREEEAQGSSPVGSAIEVTGPAKHIIPRLLRNIAFLAFLLVGPIFWGYRLAGAVGFTFGAAVSYINFRSLSRGVEGLTARIVDLQSKEKGGRIILRFVLRYLLVGGVAYVIFKGSPQAFRGFLWGLCIPAAALMAEAVWEGYTAFRRT